MDIGHTAIDVRELGTEFCHLVHFVYAFAGEEIESVEVLFVHRNEYFLVSLLDRDNSLEDGTLTVLDPLTHGVQISREINGCREDTLMVFAF